MPALTPLPRIWAARSAFGQSGPTTFDPQRQVQMFQAELETKPDALVVVNVAPPLFTQPALDAQARGAHVVWINVPPMPDVKNALFVASDAFGMGQTGGAILVSELEKMFKKPAAEISGDVVGAVEVPGLSVLENRMAGQVSYLKKKMPKINILPEFELQAGSSAEFCLVGSGNPQDAECGGLFGHWRRGRRKYSENPGHR